MVKNIEKKSSAPVYLAAAVALATFILYLPALQNGFVNWDDDVYVLDRFQIRSVNGEFFTWAFTDLSSGFWHPLTWISYAIDYAVWGLNPLGYHFTAIILHAVNTFLVVYLVYLLATGTRAASIRTASESANRGFLATAGVTGILFGIHPLHVESVAWIAERKDLLCALFFLLSVIAYVKYAAARATQETGIKNWYGAYFSKPYLLALALFGLSLSSKTMAVSLPAVLLILDWYPLRRISSFRSFLAALVEKIPFIAFSLVISIVSILAQGKFGALSHLESVSLWTRTLVAFRSMGTYLWKMALPLDLLPLYAYPKNVFLLSPVYLGALALIAGITVFCISRVRTKPYLFATWSYYVITLLPVLGIIQVGFFPMADRFTYLPSLGPFLLAGAGAGTLWTRAELSGRRGLLFKGMIVAAALMICGLLAYSTVKQISLWRTSLTLWNYVIEKEPFTHPVAYHNRGMAFRDAGNLERALDDINTAISREDREIANLYNSRALAYKEMGMQNRALEDLNKAITLDPSYANAYTNRGMTYHAQGEIERALADYDRAISLDPAQFIAYNNRGDIYKDSERPDLAIEDLTQAIRLNPSFSQAYMSRGLAFEHLGRTDLAFDDYTAGIKADPSLANTYNNRGLLLEKAGRLDEALKDLDRAIQLNPKSVEAFTNRGLVFESMGIFERAIKDHTRAIELDPKDPLSYSNRGIALERMGRTADAMKDHQKACSLGYKPGCAAVQSFARQ